MEMATGFLIQSTIEFPFFPKNKKLIAEQVFPKIFVPQQIFIIKGVNLIDNLTNLKHRKT